LKETRRNIVAKTNELIPELKPLNQDYGDLMAASEKIDKIRLTEGKQGLSGLGIKNLLTAGLNNPLNRARFAQWLYTAPKEEILNLQQKIPQLAEVIQENFKDFKMPEGKMNLGMAGKVGQNSTETMPESMNFAKNMEGNVGSVGELSAQPSVNKEPVEGNPHDIGGESERMSSEGAPSPQYAQGKQGSASMQSLREQPSTPVKEDALSYPPRTSLGNNKGIVRIGDDLSKVSKEELQDSLKYYDSLAKTHMGGTDRSQFSDAMKMVNKIKNAIAGVGKSTLGLKIAGAGGTAAYLGARS